MINLLKQNVKNKAWWVSVVSLLILLAQRFGFNLTDYIGSNWQDTLNTIFSILVLLGISVDTTTQNLGVVPNDESSKADCTENKIQENSNSTNDSIDVSSNSTNLNASAKIVVENPDNTQTIGATVNAVSANKPQ